jgi:hypothetical protein
MFKKLGNPAACEMPSVIRLLKAKNKKPAEIHRQLCDVYREHAMGSSMVGSWVRLFKERSDGAHDDPSVVNENLITTFGLEQFDHPPYSPDLAPSDFHLFLHLKSFLAGRSFHD